MICAEPYEFGAIIFFSLLAIIFSFIWGYTIGKKEKEHRKFIKNGDNK
jgi:hypothetical protein